MKMSATINPERLMQHIQEQISDTLHSHVFAPNDACTRHSVVATMTQFLDQLHQNRAFADYKVICSDENNTPSLIDSGYLVVDICIRPCGVVHEIEHIHASIGTPTIEGEIMAIGSSYGISGNYGTNQARPAPALISLTVDVNGDSKLSFSGEEKGDIVLAEFQPEHNITTYEYMNIMQLQQLLISSALTGQDLRGAVNPIELIRRHNLERHFKFSEF